MGRIDSTSWSSNAVWIVFAAALFGAAYYFFVRPRLAARPDDAPPALVSIPCRDRCHRARAVCQRDSAEGAGSGRDHAQCAARLEECVRRCGQR